MTAILTALVLTACLLMNAAVLAEEETALQENGNPADLQTCEGNSASAIDEKAVSAEAEEAVPAPETAAEAEESAKEETAAENSDEETVPAPEAAAEAEEGAKEETAAENSDEETVPVPEAAAEAEEGAKEETAAEAEDEETADAAAEESSLEEIEDDDFGEVSEERLEAFNHTEQSEPAERTGTAEIRLMNEGMLKYGEEVILRAEVRDANTSCRLVWEANDGDGRGWYELGSGEEYRFILSRENAQREYRVILMATE